MPDRDRLGVITSSPISDFHLIRFRLRSEMTVSSLISSKNGNIHGRDIIYAARQHKLMTKRRGSLIEPPL